MSKARLRRFVSRHCLGWCLAGLLLSVLQPFLFNHFRSDGWEDEPGFRLRGPGVSATFEPDARASHDDGFEVTLYAPPGAHLDRPGALDEGLGTLLALVLLLSPLSVALLSPPAPRRLAPEERVPFPGGAPPPLAAPWRRQPPRTAPP